MITIGIDPGTAKTGYGVISSNNGKNELLESGIIVTSKTRRSEERLSTIYGRVSSLINKFKPRYFVAEQLFFNTNAKTALNVGQARGAILLAASHSNLQCFEYTPLQVKQAVVGYGRADKKQVKYMVKQILSIEEKIKDDEADALAVAICHVNSYNSKIAEV